ncbi:hypothetical protein BX600DRAFT_503436 [Xylariales sp. PMI_506]|nr:hypothetical protein BX600DRAFT_503436 [Xylariales sp. PMI_506]
MLRTTRPLWASSVRAIGNGRTPILPARALPRLATLAIAPSASSRIPVTSRVGTLILRAQYATGHTGKPTPEEQKKILESKLEANPEAVTTQSSVRHLIEPSQSPSGTDPSIGGGLKHDLHTVKETFALNTVPRESYIFGLAGTIPYVATSVGNLYLSWVLNTTWPTSSSFLNSILMSHESAQHYLGVLEPIQLGYGAVIISFLGAIHWGLEYAEKAPSRQRTRFRYGLGVLASVVAWPTLFMPWGFAITTQFAAFVGLYFADARASTRGWAPPWYSAYRFVLTAVVGFAIMLSLIGRAKIGPDAPRLSGLGEKFHQTNGEEPYTYKWQRAEEAEKKKLKEEAEKKKLKEEAEKKKKKEEAAEKKKNKDEGGEKKDKKKDKKDDKDNKSAQAQEGEEDDESSKKDEAKENDDSAKEDGAEEDKGDEKEESKDEKEESNEEEADSEAEGGEEGDKKEDGSEESEGESKEDKDGSDKEDQKSKEDKSKKDDGKADQKKDNKSKKEGGKGKDGK